MTESFVPADFAVPTSFEGEGFHLEPLGPEHNERDHEAWMSSVAHIRATPGFEDWDWPEPMSLSANLADLEGHARDFAERKGFTYSVVDADEVIGCVYIYPSGTDTGGASVRSWVRESRAAMDVIVWRDVATWLALHWPFSIVLYAPRE
ncbi:MAG TPA: N-acetyltransferase [Acidimicrobiia bacterium]|nr:N-acetyltransferase [Acidimicrobiia bacterium]